MTNKKIALYNRINIRILAILLILFTAASAIVSIVNSNNIRKNYEQNFTERVLLTNALMTDSVSADDVKYFVDILRNQDAEFKERQIQYYHDRLEMWDLPEGQEPSEDMLNRMTAFCEEMSDLKNHPDNVRYWDIIAELQRLNEVSDSAYLYVMADTGLVTRDGETLYSFIFANDDEGEIDFDADGLGTSDVSLDSILSVYENKKQMDWVDYYNDIYGELYYAYAPILDENGEVIAVFGTDLDLGDMNAAIAESTRHTNLIFLGIFIVIILSLFLFMQFSVFKPLKDITDTANKLADGDIYALPPKSALKQRTEIGVLASAVNGMSLVYQDMVKSAATLFAAAKVGKLNIRSDETKFKRDIHDFIVQTNDTLDAMTLYLNNIPESIFIMNKDLEVYFKNKSFIQCFGDMSGSEFMSKVFPTDNPAENQGNEAQHGYLTAQMADALTTENFSAMVWIKDTCFSVLLKEIVLGDSAENSILVIAFDITDLVEEKEKAHAAAKAKSGFLSRMSHEMRTPMNAIIGMTKIAENSDDIAKLRYCLATIGVSASHLLGIINDVLDMSKIEAGKFELESLPINIEKILMNICNIVIDNMEKKSQKFNVVLDKGLELNYTGDALRLSQVIANLLSNAVKFTPEGGKITLSVQKVGGNEATNTLRFSVEDTGIGMTDEQIMRLFNAFEQADGSVSRKYGGTGLGLAISKSIVEKMGGRIWAKSAEGKGSTFFFEVNLDRASHQSTVIFDGIRPENLRVLIVESDPDSRKHFMDIVENFGIRADSADSAQQAEKMVKDAGKGNHYDIIFLSYELSDADAIQVAKRLEDILDKNTVIIITTFLEWLRIESDALKNDITRYITKPFFPSSILDAINDTVGKRLKSLDIKAVPDNTPRDFSDVHIILAEDVEINREILMALLEDTKISITCAENGRIAVSKFAQDPDKYDLIVMDIQMPEMDGFMATKAIRSMDIPKAKTIPIIAVTANAFKEDIDLCLQSGMNDHLAKPIDEKLLIEKIARYIGRGKK